MPAFDVGRAAIVIAHPDDETIGASVCMHSIRELIVVQVTDGAPRDMGDARANGFSLRGDYAAARHVELRRALAAAQIEPLEIVTLNYVDQEASLRLAELTLDLSHLFRRLKVSLILTHAYEGGHPDHDAVAFAVQSALELSPLELRPRCAEFASYHGCAGQIVTGRFLPAADCTESVFRLDSQERARKEQMLACYRTQQAVLAQFGTAEERFRRKPSYDFAKPPHAGALFYEAFPWGVTGDRWRSLARMAREDLGLC